MEERGCDETVAERESCSLGEKTNKKKINSQKSVEVLKR